MNKLVTFTALFLSTLVVSSNAKNTPESSNNPAGSTNNSTESVNNLDKAKEDLETTRNSPWDPRVVPNSLGSNNPENNQSGAPVAEKSAEE